MQNIKGLYINLDRDKDRNRTIARHVKSRVNYKFERFPGIKGDPNEARKRGLAAGELGIWKTWLEILKRESTSPEDEYGFLHIIEDDTRIGKKLERTVEVLIQHKTSYDIIVTDMYVNPQYTDQ